MWRCPCCSAPSAPASPRRNGWSRPMSALALVILAARVPESRASRGGGLDIMGAVLATLGLGGVTYGLIEAGRHSFLDPNSGLPILLGFLALALYLYVESHSDQPM